jgi:hypothetical protein
VALGWTCSFLNYEIMFFQKKSELSKNKNIYELQEKIIKIKFHHEKNPPSHLHIII